MQPKRHSLTLLFTLRSFIFHYKIAISPIQHLESYPLPAKGGTPPILRGERHAECISLCLLSIYPIGHSPDFITEISNLTLPLR